MIGSLTAALRLSKDWVRKDANLGLRTGCSSNSNSNRTINMNSNSNSHDNTHTNMNSNSHDTTTISNML